MFTIYFPILIKSVFHFFFAFAPPPAGAVSPPPPFGFAFRARLISSRRCVIRCCARRTSSSARRVFTGTGRRNSARSACRMASEQPCTSGSPCLKQNRFGQHGQSRYMSVVLATQRGKSQVVSSWRTAWVDGWVFFLNYNYIFNLYLKTKLLKTCKTVSNCSATTLVGIGSNIVVVSLVP